MQDAHADDAVCTSDFRVERYSETVKSVSFDKQAEIEGLLAGVKGQYLIPRDNRVLNTRKQEPLSDQIAVKNLALLVGAC